MKYAALILLLIFLAACEESSPLADQLVSERTEVVLEPTVPSLENAPEIITQNQTPAQANEQIIETEKTEENTQPVSPAEPIQETIPELNETYIDQTEDEPANTTEILSNMTVDVAHTPTRAPLYYFLDIFARKIKGYQFTYNGNKYTLKGTKYKILLSRPGTAREVTFPNGTTRRTFYYDTVYVDRVAKTATGYCEGHDSNVNHQCATLELYDMPYELQFKKYIIILPEDWLLTYLERTPQAFEEDKYYINSRSTISFTFNETNTTTELSFDQLTGLVLRADQKLDGTLLRRYDYEDLAANQVRDVDVIHQSKSEINSADAFYR